MKCHVIRDPVGRATGTIICGSGRKPQPKRCVGCGKQTALLECDGFGHAPGSDTCDKPICEACATRIPNLDLDACPDCASSMPLEGCTVADSHQECGEPLRQACAGATMHPQMICLRHLRLFGRWLLHGGWEDVYSRPEISIEEKRRQFRLWLCWQPEDAR